MSVSRFGFVLAFALVAGGLKAQAHPLTGEEVKTLLEAECAAGLKSACVRLDVMESIAAKEAADRKDSAYSSVVARTATNAAAQAKAENVRPASSYWKWLFIGLLGFFVLRVVIKALASVKDNDLPPSPQLDRPSLALGQRTMQGVLMECDTLSDLQIVPWDKTKVMNWIRAEMEKVRPKVKNQQLLQLCDDQVIVWSISKRVPVLASTFLVYDELTAKPSDEAGKDPDLYYNELAATLNGTPGAAYSLAHMAWMARGVTDHDIIVGLFRLDADMEFQPALINLCAYCEEKGINDQAPFAWDVREAYLRHHFDIGAPDGHSHLAHSLAVFYMWLATNRPDNGYVAAAYKRLNSYFDTMCQQIRERVQEWPDTWTLDDNSVSVDGWMHDHAYLQGQTLH